jgi:hypothetical protein
MAKDAFASNGRSIATVYERDMDLVLVEELESNPEFRAWLVARVYGADCYLKHLGAHHSVVDETNRESDVVFRFVADDCGAEVAKAILIENKIDALAQPNQGADYRVRGEAGTGREDWSEFRTCLMAPRQYIKGSTDWAHFDEVVTYEEVLAFFASRKTRDERFAWKARLVASSIMKKASGYTPVISEEATAFVHHYYLHAKAWPRLRMSEPKPRPAGSTWISFRPDALPRGAVIEHLVTAGEVRVMFYGAADRLDILRQQLLPHLAPTMEIRQAGKSVAVSMKVPPIPAITVPFAQVQAGAEAAMRAADELAAMMATVRAAGVRL